MHVFLRALCVLLITISCAWARGTSIDSLSSSPVETITSDELAKIPATDRSIGDLISQLPSFSQQRLIIEDTNAAKSSLRQNLVLMNGRRVDPKDSQFTDFLSHSAQDTQAMIDRIEVIQGSSASATYGMDSVINIITRRPMEVHPNELPLAATFTLQEQMWQKMNIPIGRIGLSKEDGQWNWGMSAYKKDSWSWTPSWSLGQSYGLNGPIVAIGKTSNGPGISIFNPYGVFVGDVNKTKLTYDPYVTSKYLIRAQNYQYQDFNKSYNRQFYGDNFSPHSVIVFPQYGSFGDTFQRANILNNGLHFNNDYDDFQHSMNGQCVPPYGDEPIYSRSILKKSKSQEPQIEPNDPYYPSPKIKKKLKTGITGFLTNVISIGAGDPEPVKTNKPDVKDQYSLPQIGFMPKSDPNSAWNMVDTKGPNVLVAVIDSGLDLSHPDKPEFIWKNSKEIADNKIDDDQNGYVDDVHGWNFLDENADVKDLRGHGTIVAGIIAAKTNNGQGIAGINPGAVIMPLKVVDKQGHTNSLSIYRAIHYAVARGARVVNISLGARGVSFLEHLAINYARAHNVLVVIASGNNNDDIGIFGPSSAGSAIAVGALNFDGSRSTVSNWGANNSLVAPGEEIYSLHSKDAPWDGPSGQKERLYTKASGTSFSAPMVAATASLLLIKDPKMTADQMEDILLSSAKRLDENTWNGYTGAGLLDAVKALKSNPQDIFNIRITGLKPVYQNNKKIDYVDVYATVRGSVDYFIVEVGKGRNARNFKTIIGFSGQQAKDDLVARIDDAQLRGSTEWVIMVRAKDKSGREYKAQTPLKLK